MQIREPVTTEEASAFLTTPLKANPDLPFFIFASCGNPDAEEMKVQMKYIPKLDGFSYGKDTAKSNIFLPSRITTTRISTFRTITGIP